MHTKFIHIELRTNYVVTSVSSRLREPLNTNHTNKQQTQKRTQQYYHDNKP